MKKIIHKLKNDSGYNDYLIMLVVGVINILALLIFYISLKVKVSVFGIMTDLLFLCLLYILINLIKKVLTKKIFLTVFFSLSLFALMADSTYFYQYKSFASVTSLLFVNNIVGQKYGINLPLTCYILIPLLAFGLFFIWYTKVNAKSTPLYKRRINLSLTLAFVFMFMAVNLPYSIYNIVKAKNYKEYDVEFIHSDSYLYNNVYSSYKFVEVFGYCNFRLRDAVYVPSESEYKDEEVLKDYFDDFNYKKQQNDWSEKYAGYNVITILGETFDHRFSDPDYIGNELVKNKSIYIDEDATLNPVEVGNTFASIATPNLYKIRQDALTFSNYYVPTFFEGATINSEFMANNGIFALNAKNFSSNLGDTYYNNNFKLYSLSGQLKNNGYESYYFHNDSENFYNRKKLTANENFDNTRFDEDLNRAGTITEKMYDTRLLEFFELEDIKTSLQDNIDNGNPFYMQLDTYSMHLGNEQKYDHYENQIRSAFETSGIDYDKIEQQKITQVLGYYLKMAEFDRFLGLLIDKLNAPTADNPNGLNVLDKTLIVLYPDHYNYVLNPNIMETYIGVSAFDKEIHHQNLFMIDGAKWNNSVDDRQVIDILSSTIDITPTILNMVVGAEKAEYKYYFGKDIFEEGKKIVAFSDITVFDGENYLYADGKLKSNNYDASDEQYKQIYDELSMQQIEILKKFDMSKAILELDFYNYLDKVI